jgi:hypothetical protein
MRNDFLIKARATFYVRKDQVRLSQVRSVILIGDSKFKLELLFLLTKMIAKGKFVT